MKAINVKRGTWKTVLKRQGPLLLPAAHDALSARLIERAAFNETVREVFPTEQDFQGYTKRWGVVQAAQVLVDLQSEGKRDENHAFVEKDADAVSHGLRVSGKTRCRNPRRGHVACMRFETTLTRRST